MNPQGRTFEEKKIYIYIFHQNITPYIEIQWFHYYSIVNRQCSGHIDRHRDTTLIRLTKYFICKCLRQSLFLVLRSLQFIFCASLTLWWKALRCLPLSMHSLLDSTLSQPNGEEDSGLTPWRATFAHVTVTFLTMSGLVTGPAALSVLWLIIFLFCW